jgi:A/G-specific adenine glycosylase
MVLEIFFDQIDLFFGQLCGVTRQGGHGLKGKRSTRRVEGKKKNVFARAALLAWYSRSRRDLPWRRTKDPYAILVSEVMLQQTQVKTVIPYYQRWMAQFPDAASLASAPEEQVLKLWEGLGYYRRARNLQAAARAICGHFPETLDGLLSLPGVGRYTAGAVGSMAFGLKLPVVDGNVSRVLARFLGVKNFIKSPEVQARLWSWMESAMPEKDPGDFNQAMMELGATVCAARAPLCDACPLRNECWARRHGWQDRLPKSEKVESVGRVESAVLIRDAQTIWLVLRKAGEWHEGLWALPSVLRPDAADDWMGDFDERFGLRIETRKASTSSRYQVTQHRIELRVYETAPTKIKSPDLKARGLEELDSLPMVTAHRKSLQRLKII